MQRYRSNGKLLLTGEYLVLDGALALAIPTSFSQSLRVAKVEVKGIHWQSLDHEGNCWYENTFQVDEDISSKETDEITATLVRMLREANKLNPGFLKDNDCSNVTTILDFSRDWGLGSSSTLLNNIAQWAGVNPYTLLWNSFGGSGYDIAAASSDTPLLYSVTDRQPKVTRVSINWPFSDELHFIHLNQKQDSREGIEAYRKIEVDETIIARISKISMEILTCTSLIDFRQLLELHEAIISQLLRLPTVKDRLFADYPGLVKSLGAWGGDFVMVSGSREDLKYFSEKGFHTQLAFSEMIK